MHLVYKKIKKNINIILQNKWDLNLKKYVCKAYNKCKEIEKE